MVRDLRTIARALGGEVYGRQVLCPGPGHSAKDRSLSVTFEEKAPDGFLIYSHAGDDWRECRDYVRLRLGVFLVQGDRKNVLSRLKYIDAVEDRSPRGLDIWDQASGPFGSPVEDYLRERGLQLPLEAAQRAIRYHPNCPWREGQRTSSMVCLVRDVLTNRPLGIHRTAVTQVGRKAIVAGRDRLALGPTRGGAVKLTPDEEVSTCLGVGEGIETVLSLRSLPEYGASPVWSLLQDGGIKRLPVLPGVEVLWIAVDHDCAGLRAAHTCARRWQDAGREVILVMSRAPREDLNDLLRVRHA